MAVSREAYYAVVLCGHATVRVEGIFTTLMGALAYAKANYQCVPLGARSFQTRHGEVLKVQSGVHIYTSED